MLRISEVTKKLGVSRSTVYNYIKELDTSLESHLHKEKGVQYIDDEGFELLRKLSKSKGVGNDAGSAAASLHSLLMEEHDILITELRDRVKFLESRLEKKDTELERAMNLLENSQVLLKQEQDRTLLLEEKIGAEAEEPVVEKAGFWKRISSLVTGN